MGHYAAVALRTGMPAHVLSKRLGHANPAITMDVYAHVLADMEQAGAMSLDTLCRQYAAKTAVSADKIN